MLNQPFRASPSGPIIEGRTTDSGMVLGILPDGSIGLLSGDNVIWVGPPIDGIQDDWAAINDAVQLAPEGYIVRLRYSTLPYVCNSTTVVGRSNITLDLNGNTIQSRSEYSLSTCPIIVGVQAFPPVIALKRF